MVTINLAALAVFFAKLFITIAVLSWAVAGFCAYLGDYVHNEVVEIVMVISYFTALWALALFVFEVIIVALCAMWIRW